MDGLNAPVCDGPIDPLKLSPIPYSDRREINVKSESLQIYEQRIFPFRYAYRFKFYIHLQGFLYKLILRIIIDYFNYVTSKATYHLTSFVTIDICQAA